MGQRRDCPAAVTSHKATFYLQLEADVNQRYIGGEHREAVTGIRAVAITQKRPTRPRSGAVITKLTIQVPDGAFLPLRPEAVVVIPEGMTELSPIQVEAIDPHDPEES